MIPEPLSRQLLEAVFEGTSEAILITNPQARITAVNGAFQQITGYHFDEVVGQNPRLLSSGRQSDDFYRDMWNTLLARGAWQGEIWNRRKNGEIYPEWLSIQAVHSEDGQVLHYVGVFSDLTEEKAKSEAIQQLVHHDPLTRLPNRILLRDRLRQMIASAQRKAARVAVLCLNLDRFKIINGSLGYQIGDRVLQEVAARVRDSVREIDTVSRFAADELIVLLPEIGRAADAARVAQRILQSLSRPLQIGERELSVSASLGLSFYPDNGTTVDDLLRSAEVAMFHAKENGRKRHHFFDQEMEARTTELLAVETSLRRGLAQGDVVLQYQPRIDLRTGLSDSVEARLFWQHPELGLLGRDLFAQVAEESGLSQDLDAWSLRAACRQVRDWDREGEAGVIVAVKLSPLCLLQGDLGGLVWNALSETGVDPRRLEIEFGEGSVARDNDTVALTLERLRDLGVRVALGNFGNGVSNLSCLKRVTVDRLKISPFFIGDLAAGTQDEEIVRAVITLGHGLGLQVLAEGVETRGQLEILHALGCDQVQGDYCARAMPAEELADWLRAQVPRAGRRRGRPEEVAAGELTHGSGV